MSSPALAPENLSRSKKYTRLAIGMLELQAFVVLGAAYLFQRSGYNDRLSDTLLEWTGNYFASALIFAVIFFGAMFIISCLTTVARHTLDRSFGLNKASLGTWLRSVSKVLWLKFVAEVVAACTIFYSARFIGASWWIPASILSAIYVYFLFAWYAPAMYAAFGPEVPLSQGPFRDRLFSLCRRAGVEVREIYEWKIGERSTIGNAMVTGLGKDRRILISDTLLQLCTEDEAEAILAHELGHEVNHDVRWRALYRLVTQVLICWIICKVGFLFFDVSPTDLSALPGLWVAYYILSVYAQLGLASRARRQEAAADLYAWKLMGTSRTLISGIQKLTAANLLHIKKGSKRFGHPSLEERMAEADRFERSLHTAPNLFGSIN